MMRYLIKNEDGSSSILVIILMVVLMVFGLAVLTTSLSNLRLSEKKRSWLADYYKVEGLAEKEIALIDHLLSESEDKALKVMEDGSYVDDYMLDGPVSGSQWESIYAVVYHDIMTETILDYIAGNQESSLAIGNYDIDAILSGNAIPVSRLDFDTAIQGEAYPKHISVTLALHNPTTTGLDGDNRLMKRFGIERFEQWQAPFEYDEGIDFDDPFSEGAIIEGGDNPFEEENPLGDNPFGE